MTMGRASSQQAGTHGRRSWRACQNCARVKERCIPMPHSDVESCQRCYRLQKECTRSAPAARPRPPAGRGSERPARMTGPLPTPPHALQSPSPSENYSACGYWEGYAALEADYGPISTTLNALDVEKKDALFQDYCSNMITYFPFVQFDAPSTASSRSSFAYAASIVAALYRQPALQRQISQELLKYMSTSMLMHGHKSLDLLRGILLLLVWYPFYSQRNPQLMNLLHLAQALLIDLGLTRSHASAHLPIRIAPNVPELLHGATVNAPHDSLPECRVLLGFYYASAQIAVNLRRLEHPHWTARMEQCCRWLESSADRTREDALATHLLRLHVAAERYLGLHGIKPSVRSSGRADARESELAGLNGGVSIREYVNCFTEDIERVSAVAPPWLAEHHLVKMHRYMLEITLYDAVNSVSNDASGQADKIDALHALLARDKLLFELICAVSPEDMPNFSVLTWSIVGQAVDILAKLTFLKQAGWDLAHVRQQLNISEVVERLTDKFMEVFLCERRRYPTLDASQFAVFPVKLRQFRKWYEERIAREASEGADTTLTPGEMASNDSFGGEFGDGMWLGEAWLDLCMDEMQWS